MLESDIREHLNDPEMNALRESLHATRNCITKWNEGIRLFEKHANDVMEHDSAPRISWVDSEDVYRYGVTTCDLCTLCPTRE